MSKSGIKEVGINVLKIAPESVGLDSYSDESGAQNWTACSPRKLKNEK
jgi:hypothetical protein